MIYELSTQCSGGMEARPLTELYALIPEELRKKMLNACGPGTSMNCLFEYIVQYGEEVRNRMRWIKAADRLPAIGKRVFVRVSENHSLMAVLEHTVDNTWDGDDYNSWYFDDTEWLEEIPVPQHIQSKEPK